MGWFANCLNIVGLLLLGYKCRQGWLLGIAAEVIWVNRAYGLGMYDLMFISGVYIVIASVNYARWSAVPPVDASRTAQEALERQ